jgi:small subunit ribosomal protein S35
VQVRDLFDSGRLNDSDAARKKLLLLAGVRWDSMGEEVGYQDDMKNFEKVAIEKGVGQIKINCERYPEERMNLKWCSDTIDKLIEEANVSADFARESMRLTSSYRASPKR